MSRVQFEKDLAEFLDGVLKEAEAKIAEWYPGAFAGFPEMDSPGGVSRPRPSRPPSGGFVQRRRMGTVPTSNRLTGAGQSLYDSA
jgi:hypothetical protein